MSLLLVAFACSTFSSTLQLEAEDDSVFALGDRVCVDSEAPSGSSCTHTFGGLYADGACSAGFQCCDGAWGSHGACGSCACTEASGEQGCAPEPVGASCEHSFGGVYSDGACSAGFQCCDGAWGTRDSCGACDCVEPTGEYGCGTSASTECFEAFGGDAAPLSQELRDQMWGTSWSPGCPVHLDSLVLLTVSHWNLDGEARTGRLVVREDVAPVVLEVLRVAWEARFPIERMEPVSGFAGSDDASMAANNTSAFNCRSVTGGNSWSQHSYGDAIDINPQMNPYVSGSTVLPPGGVDYLDRNPSDPGVLVGSSAVTEAFLAAGWRWGGDWSSRKDFQHFSANGR